MSAPLNDARRHPRLRIATGQVDTIRIGDQGINFGNVDNALNPYDTWQRYGPETPGYARNYETRGNGVQTMLGLKGSF